ncbi:preprotein translocase subunit SecE [Candidatus Kaiserbacteria bacterium RIFCSPHIGHO2_01_FULL_56_24]|uniref:Protein translocase subunit SecE n=1 Tax=Candidatus Kaiserbacteria bacterium RIFCSPHIGHO2_01_FULL_56_24 TaxID=1798487 RepID=A0A1F6DB01_9BACT|nr:MAG: preprotein translocase subunit SecE [Candidatus Kaiserbacteria bacterium RIFCSPHIGHO2_01_FULL_56_24]
MGVVQYLKDTRSELNHVAWPTRVQTIVFTILVIAISILVSLYLGLLDFAFTSGLAKAVETLPHQTTTQPLDQLQISTTTVATTTQKQ